MSRPATQPEVTIPAHIAVALALVMTVALVVTYLSDAAAGVVHVGQRIANAVFATSLAGYLFVSIIDFAEHFRLERAKTGSYFTMVAVPFGESVNHALTVVVMVSILSLARPLHQPLEARDLWVLMGPVVFLALGWRDELVYHRRRCAHREDIMHTIAHLAAGVMLSARMAAKLVDWDSLAPLVR